MSKKIHSSPAKKPMLDDFEKLPEPSQLENREQKYLRHLAFWSRRSTQAVTALTFFVGTMLIEKAPHIRDAFAANNILVTNAVQTVPAALAAFWAFRRAVRTAENLKLLALSDASSLKHQALMKRYADYEISYQKYEAARAEHTSKQLRSTVLDNIRQSRRARNARAAAQRGQYGQPSLQHHKP